MKRFLLSTVIYAGMWLFAFSATSFAQPAEIDVKPVIHEIEQALAHYRIWLVSPEMINVLKGTNHAARATVLIDTYLEAYANDEPEKEGVNRRIGIRGIRSLLLKQMRIHVDLLSTNVPQGIAEYNESVEKGLEEQLNLLEQSLREFERHQVGG